MRVGTNREGRRIGLDAAALISSSRMNRFATLGRWPVPRKPGAARKCRADAGPDAEVYAGKAAAGIAGRDDPLISEGCDRKVDFGRRITSAERLASSS